MQQHSPFLTLELIFLQWAYHTRKLNLTEKNGLHFLIQRLNLGKIS